MNFDEVEKYLLSLGNEVSAMKLGLENTRKLLAALGNPHEKYLKVQVAGTNGKGSVCAFLNSICLRAGIRTGMYTSPHLVSITERIQIDGVDISEDDFAKFATPVRETSEALVAGGAIENIPTFFEQVTAIALIAFAEAKVELAILETGLGGRLDATTAANAEIAAITRIDLDHQRYLGETIEEIAAEKAAIIHCNSLVCIGAQSPDAMNVTTARCVELGITPKTLHASQWSADTERAKFSIGSFKYDEIAISLAGDHQIENAALAILTAQELRKFFDISDENIIHGLGRAQHPGRIEWFEVGDIRVLLDGAHNRGGAEALAKYLRPWWGTGSIALVYAAMNDKDYKSILEVLGPLVTDLILTESKNTRSHSSRGIADAMRDVLGPNRVFAVKDVSAALDAAIQLANNYPANQPALVLVSGSLYLVGEVRRMLTAKLPEKLKTNN